MLGNTERAKQFIDLIWNDRNFDYVHNLFSLDCVIHSPLGKHSTPKEMLEIVGIWTKAFPDLRVHLEQITEESNRVVLQWWAEGTHNGEFKCMSPSNAPIRYNGATVLEFKEGRVSQYWAYVNIHTILDQIKAAQV